MLPPLRLRPARYRRAVPGVRGGNGVGEREAVTSRLARAVSRASAVGVNGHGKGDGTEKGTRTERSRCGRERGDDTIEPQVFLTALPLTFAGATVGVMLAAVAAVAFRHILIGLDANVMRFSANAVAVVPNSARFASNVVAFVPSAIRFDMDPTTFTLNTITFSAKQIAFGPNVIAFRSNNIEFGWNAIAFGSNANAFGPNNI